MTTSENNKRFENVSLFFDNVLYIIGNGFDLHHGVRSSYDYFQVWLQKNDNETYQLYKDICQHNALWADFETGMAYVDREYFIDNGALFLPDSSKDPDDYTMADLLLGGDIASSTSKELLDHLKEDFHKWICSIKSPKNYEERKVHMDYYARFLTFNYTTFLESHYGIECERICYIHGKKTQPWGHIIVGHGEDTKKLYDEWWRRKKHDKNSFAYQIFHGKSKYLPENEKIIEGIEAYYEDAKKPTGDIILKHGSFFNNLSEIEHIYVWGFSFSKVDIPYIQRIKEMNEHPDSIIWHVSYYSEKDKDRANACLKGIGVSQDKIQFDMLSNNLISR